MEIWKDIVGYETAYEVSNLGNVRSKPRIDSNGRRRRGIVLKPKQERNKYLRVHLSLDNEGAYYTVHRLVAIAFVPKADGCNIVNHLDNDPTNNKATNLEWTTYKGNMQHAAKQGRMKWHPENQRKSAEARRRPVMAIKGDEVIYFSHIREAEAMGFDHRHISSCCKGRYGCKTHKGYEWRYQS